MQIYIGYLCYIAKELGTTTRPLASVLQMKMNVARRRSQCLATLMISRFEVSFIKIKRATTTTNNGNNNKLIERISTFTHLTRKNTSLFSLDEPLVEIFSILSTMDIAFSLSPGSRLSLYAYNCNRTYTCICCSSHT